ncbi:MAG: amidase family protein [Pseudomonadota bacterium]
MTKLDNQYTGPELCAHEAHEVVALLRKGEVSPAELLEASRARVEATEPAINAMPTACWERAASARYDKEADHHAYLAGLPMGIKDLTTVAGVRTTFGTKGLENFIPKASDPLVERLEARGGIVVGKTNTPELGAGGNTFNDVFGATLNPWNTRKNAAGSSGGAAAGLAAGQVWLSHGSDHGGSLRTPAAYHGIVGLRPSPGRAGGSGPDAAFMIEGAQGPMARSVTDCALFLDAMAGFEPRFPTSYPAPEVPYMESVQHVPTRPRMAFAPDLNGFCPVDADMADHLATAMTTLEGQGAVVEEVKPDTKGLYETYHTLRGMMWAVGVAALPPGVRPHFKETLEENTQFGLDMEADRIFRAQTMRSRLYREMLGLFDHFDVLALPVVGCMAHDQSVEWVDEIGGEKLPHYMDWLRFSFLATVTGLPALSVPVSFHNAMPVGLQLIGRPRDEAGLLQMGRFVELAMGGPNTPIDPVIGY